MVERPHAITLAIPVARWYFPPAGWVKLKTDGSWLDDGQAGAGMVLSDSRGNDIFLTCRDALESEL